MDDALTPDAPPPKITGDHPMKMADLEVFEVTGAGHALSRHVHDADGQFTSDADRLQRDPWIPASGAFTDRAMAQRCVDAAVSHNHTRITAWLPVATPANPFITELALGFANGTNLSREQYDRGQRTSEPTTGVRIVLFGDSRFTSGFAVHTAYNVAVPPPPTHVYRYGDVRISAFEPAGFASQSAANAVAQALTYWSTEIDQWIARGEAVPFRRTYCADRTLALAPPSPRGRAAGQTWATATPLINVELAADWNEPYGFRVVKASPSRGF